MKNKLREHVGWAVVWSGSVAFCAVVIMAVGGNLTAIPVIGAVVLLPVGIWLVRPYAGELRLRR